MFRAYKRGDMWWGDFHVRHKRYRRSLQTRNKTEALRNAKYIEEDLWRGAGSDAGSSMTLEQAFDRTWREHWSTKKDQTVKCYTIEQIQRDLGSDTKLSDLTANRLANYQAWLLEQGNSPKTVNRKLSTITAALNRAVMWGVLPFVPRVERFKETGSRIRIVTIEEEHRLLQACADHELYDLRRLVIFLLDTGARLGEALRLEYRDVADDQVTLWQTKGGNPRTIPMTPRVRALLSSGGSSSGPVFGISKDQVRRQWNRIRKALGLGDDKEFVPHCLRHTAATRLLEATNNIKLVKEYLGHSSVKVTEIYTHLNPEALRKGVSQMSQAFSTPAVQAGN